MNNISSPLTVNNSLFITHSVRMRDLNLYVNEVLQEVESNDTESFLVSIYKSLGVAYPKFYKMDIMSKAGFIASEIIMKEIHCEVSEFKKGIIFQNSSSSLDTDIRYHESIQDIPSPALFVYTLPNIVMGEIAIRHHFKGENTFFVSNEFDPEQLVNYTNLLFNSNVLDFAIIGFIEVRNNQLDILICSVQREGKKVFSIDEMKHLYSQNKK